MSATSAVHPAFVCYRIFPHFWTSGRIESFALAEAKGILAGEGRYRVERINRWAFGGMSGTYHSFVTWFEVTRRKERKENANQ